MTALDYRKPAMITVLVVLPMVVIGGLSIAVWRNVPVACVAAVITYLSLHMYTRATRRIRANAAGETGQR